MPSGSETFGLAALEAMSCGVPAVASNIGGLPELIEDGISGYLCPVNDVDAFTDRIRSILANEGTLTSMSAAARRRAEHFDSDRVIPVYEDYYRAVIEQTGVVLAD
jgi:glycosyltransferase involved in cell wall biosynthesis